jgi:hypothetical protein
MSYLSFTVGSIFFLALGVIIGAGAVIFRIVTQEIDRRKKEKLPYFFCNLVVTNKNEIIDHKVQERRTEKLKRREIPINLDPLNFGVRATEAVAHKVVSDNKFMLQLGTEVAKGIKDKFSPRNIVASGELSYVQGMYAVIKVTIHKIDPIFLMSEHLDEKKMNTLRKAVHWIGYLVGEDNVKFGIRSQLTRIVVEQSIETLGEGMINILHDEQGVEADVVVKSNEEQSDFFYELVKPGQSDSEVTSAKLHSFDDKGANENDAPTDNETTPLRKSQK